jgi:hypothetical protein
MAEGGAVTTSSADQPVLLQIQDLCQRLGTPVRDARYLCEQNWLPRGVPPEPGRGNHRRLTIRQGMWLGIVLKLKAAGLKTPLAVQVAAFAEEIRGRTNNLGWEGKYSPFDDALDTQQRWYIEVGDQTYLRFVTDTSPNQEGLDQLPWVEMSTRRPAEGVQPIVCVRIDLSGLARLLRGPPGDSDGGLPDH